MKNEDWVWDLGFGMEIELKLKLKLNVKTFRKEREHFLKNFNAMNEVRLGLNEIIIMRRDTVVLRLSVTFCSKVCTMFRKHM